MPAFMAKCIDCGEIREVRPKEVRMARVPVCFNCGGRVEELDEEDDNDAQSDVL